MQGTDRIRKGKKKFKITTAPFHTFPCSPSKTVERMGGADEWKKVLPSVSFFGGGRKGAQQSD